MLDGDVIDDPLGFHGKDHVLDISFQVKSRCLLSYNNGRKFISSTTKPE